LILLGKRTLAGDVARKAEFDEVHVRKYLAHWERPIDFSFQIPFISLAAPDDEVVTKLRDACTRVGFMYIKVDKSVLINVIHLPRAETR
jgi:hypothetical protein